MDFDVTKKRMEQVRMKSATLLQPYTPIANSSSYHRKI